MSTKADFILEIGTEELPASAILPASQFIIEELNKKLKSQGISFKKSEFFATPRRLIIHIEELNLQSPPKKKIIWGPPKNIAYNPEGEPTKALLGFLKKANASLEEVQIGKKGKGEYVYIEKIEEGIFTEELLRKTIPEILDKVPFEKRMRWDNSGKTFLRPVRWIVALLGNKILEFQWGNIKASNITYGHRYINNDGSFSGKALVIEKPKEIFKLLKEHGVIYDHREREKLIEEALSKYEKAFNGRVALKEKLLKENVFLTEYIYPVLGEFPEKYLQLPPLVIITVIAHHQRCFCFQTNEGKVINKFLAISNNQPLKEEIVRKGYERVIKARLEDALFFYKEDLKTQLEERVPYLKEIIQHPKLGSLYDKTQRLIKISEKLSEKINPAIKEKVRRASYLSKADLLTEMVKELDELQGYMGYIYAKAQGEDEEVALALWEQYKPKGKDNEEEDIPQTEVGAILSLADKIHDLIGYFGIGEKPKSTADPYGLRRATLGIIRILERKKYPIDLREIFKYSYSLFDNLKDYESLIKELEEFFRQRLYNYLTLRIPATIVKAVLNVKDGLAVNEIIEISQFLNTIRESEELEKIKEAYKRITRILGKNTSLPSVEEKYLIEKEEKELYKKIQELKKIWANLNNEEKIKQLLDLKEKIDLFFDHVMVMVKDEKLRKNRLALLQEAKNFYEYFGNLDLIS
jgi:glycyl-tRNA synthetase beta chain